MRRVKFAEDFGQKKAWQRPTLPPSRGSTIGAAGLNFRVRDGNGWNPCAIVTRQIKTRVRMRYRHFFEVPAAYPSQITVSEGTRRRDARPTKGRGHKRIAATGAPRTGRLPRQSYLRFRGSESAGENMVKPHGKLVLVSLMRYRTYTSSLSTWFSPRYLQGD